MQLASIEEQVRITAEKKSDVTTKMQFVTPMVAESTVRLLLQKEQKEFTPEMAFMGFLMATATIGGIFFLPALIIMVVNIVS